LGCIMNRVIGVDHSEHSKNSMNSNPNLKFAPLIVRYDGRQLALPLWTIVSIKGSDDSCNIETSDGHNMDSWIIDETFDTVMERYLTLLRST
jgi:hypothetical protein